MDYITKIQKMSALTQTDTLNENDITSLENALEKQIDKLENKLIHCASPQQIDILHQHINSYAMLKQFKQDYLKWQQTGTC